MSASAHVPSVGERLRSSLVLCAALHHCVLLADEHHVTDLPGFSPAEIVKLVPSFADALRAQVEAIKRALPASCQDIDAPATGGAR
jgi:hypothetical protein